MSKRSYRRLAVVAGAAVALGSMAPAMAQRLDVSGVAGASVSVDPAEATSSVTDVTNILGPTAIPSTDDAVKLGILGIGIVDGQVTFVNNLVKGHELYAQSLANDVLGKVVTLGGLGTSYIGGGDCGLVNVASCDSIQVPVSASGVNVLGSGINVGDLGVAAAAPIAANVMAPINAAVQNVGILTGGPLGLGTILDPHAGLLATVGLGL